MYFLFCKYCFFVYTLICMCKEGKRSDLMRGWAKEKNESKGDEFERS